MIKLGWLFLAGGCGCLARYGLSGLVQRLVPSGLPLGTFVVNIVGCLAFGCIWSLAEERVLISGEARFFILAGFCGSFTTFSTFAFESSEMLRDSQWLFAAGNVLAHNFLGVLAILLGWTLGKLI